MDTVVIDGVTYTKASILAKQFQYTADYIGQLCRSDKVQAQLVGRSWYVSSDSLESYASKRVESIRQDEMSLENNPFLKENSEPIKVSAPLSKLTKKMLHPGLSANVSAHTYTSARYEPDPADVLPVLRIRPSVPDLGSAKNKAPEIESSISNPPSDIVDDTQISSQLDADSFSSTTIPIKINTNKVANKPYSKPYFNTAPSNQSSIKVQKQLSFTPVSVGTPSTKSLFPYKTFSLAVFLLGVGAVLATLALDLEIHYDGTVSSTDFSINQTALVNLFK